MIWQSFQRHLSRGLKNMDMAKAGMFLQDDDTATPENSTVYFYAIHNYLKTGTVTTHVIDLYSLPAITHTHNWLIIATTLSELNLLKTILSR